MLYRSQLHFFPLNQRETKSKGQLPLFLCHVSPVTQKIRKTKGTQRKRSMNNPSKRTILKPELPGFYLKREPHISTFRLELYSDN